MRVRPLALAPVKIAYSLSEEEIDEFTSYQGCEELKQCARPATLLPFFDRHSAHLTQKVLGELFAELPRYPRSFYSRYNLLLASYHLHRSSSPNRTESFLQEVLRENPHSRAALATYTVLQCEKGDREKAAVFWRRYRDLQKTKGDDNIERAVLFQVFGLSVAARQLYEAALTTTAAASNPDKNFVSFQLGRILLNHATGRIFYDGCATDRAIVLLSSVQKAFPVDFLFNTLLLTEALNYKWSQRNTGCHPTALALVESLAGHRLQPSFFLTKILWTVEQYKKAEAVLEDIPEKTPALLELLGDCLEAVGDSTGALSAYEKARTMSDGDVSQDSVLKEATILLNMGRRTEAMALANSVESDCKHHAAEISLFLAEINIAVYPEVLGTLEDCTTLLYSSFSKPLYQRYLRVIHLFTQHLAKFYTSTGLPSNQVETLHRWVRFLEARGEVPDGTLSGMVAKQQELSVRPTRRLSITARGILSASKRKSTVVSPGANRSSPVHPPSLPTAAVAESTSTPRRRVSVVQAPRISTSRRVSVVAQPGFLSSRNPHKTLCTTFETDEEF